MMFAACLHVRAHDTARSYALMLQCWESMPVDRPPFAEIVVLLEEFSAVWVSSEQRARDTNEGGPGNAADEDYEMPDDNNMERHRANVARASQDEEGYEMPSSDNMRRLAAAQGPSLPDTEGGSVQHTRYGGKVRCAC